MPAPSWKAALRALAVRRAENRALLQGMLRHPRETIPQILAGGGHKAWTSTFLLLPCLCVGGLPGLWALSRKSIVFNPGSVREFMAFALLSLLLVLNLHVLARGLFRREGSLRTLFSVIGIAALPGFLLVLVPGAVLGFAYLALHPEMFPLRFQAPPADPLGCLLYAAWVLAVVLSNAWSLYLISIVLQAVYRGLSRNAALAAAVLSIALADLLGFLLFSALHLF